MFDVVSMIIIFIYPLQKIILQFTVTLTDRKTTVLPLPSVWMVSLSKHVTSVFTMRF